MGKDSVTDGWSALLKPAFLPAVSVLVGCGMAMRGRG